MWLKQRIWFLQSITRVKNVFERTIFMYVFSLGFAFESTEGGKKGKKNHDTTKSVKTDAYSTFNTMTWSVTFNIDSSIFTHFDKKHSEKVYNMFIENKNHKIDDQQHS